MTVLASWTDPMKVGEVLIHVLGERARINKRFDSKNWKQGWGAEVEGTK